MPAAAHHRFCAKGKSLLIVHTSMSSPRLVASSLNRLVSVSHTGVSSDGTELSITTFPLALFKLTGWRPVSSATKSGASSPGLISGPPRVIGVPLTYCREKEGRLIQLIMGQAVQGGAVVGHRVSTGAR